MEFQRKRTLDLYPVRGFLGVAWSTADIGLTALTPKDVSAFDTMGRISTARCFLPNSRTVSRLLAYTVTEGDEMNSDYVFLCGVMWCGYGQQEAGRELLRAALSRDADISSLAWAMFAKGKTALREKLVAGHGSIES